MVAASLAEYCTAMLYEVPEARWDAQKAGAVTNPEPLPASNRLDEPGAGLPLIVILMAIAPVVPP